jgi:predicted transcriptional regulator
MSEEFQSEENSQGKKFDRYSIEWRRNYVLERLSLGYNQSEIAKELQLHPSTISLDCQYLKQKAKDNLQTHIDERLPLEYEESYIGLKRIMKRAEEISNKPGERTSDILHALALKAEIYDKLMSLEAGGPTLQAAVSYIEKKKAELQRLEQSEEEEKEQDINADHRD